MTRNRWLRLLIFLLLAYFLLTYVSRVFFNIGQSGRSETRAQFQTISTRIFPFDYYTLYETGFSLLKGGIEGSDNKKISRSVQLLRRSIAINPLYYPAHVFLAKALIAENYPMSQRFAEAVQELKIAALIRPKNLDVALDTIKALFSLWPFLEKRDQAICTELLSDNIEKIGWKDFEPVLDLWWQHNQDVGYLVSLMKKNPELYYPVSRKLVDYRLPLKLRWEFLAVFETDAMEKCNAKFQSAAYFAFRQTPEILNILNQLKGIHGYGMLLPDNEPRLKWAEVVDMKKKVYLEMIHSLLRRDVQKMKAEERRQLETWILEFLDIAAPADRLHELREWLLESKFFRPNDTRSLMIRSLIDLKSSSLSDVITQLEGYRRTMSYVRSEDIPDSSRLLLILTDAYISSRLMTQASEILRNLTEMLPGNSEIYWRLMKVETVFGKDAQQLPEDQAGRQKVYDSRLITVRGHDLEQKVFVFDQPQIEIRLSDELRKNLYKYRLFQVFLDERIVQEYYVEEIPEVVTISAEMVTIGNTYSVRTHMD